MEFSLALPMEFIIALRLSVKEKKEDILKERVKQKNYRINLPILAWPPGIPF